MSRSLNFPFSTRSAYSVTSKNSLLFVSHEEKKNNTKENEKKNNNTAGYVLTLIWVLICIILCGVPCTSILCTYSLIFLTNDQRPCATPNGIRIYVRYPFFRNNYRTPLPPFVVSRTWHIKLVCFFSLFPTSLFFFVFRTLTTTTLFRCVNTRK